MNNYRAVNLKDLKATLNYQCSPNYNNKNAWYVIGPDINNRLCHCATCSDKKSAIEYAKTLNKNIK